jgi:subtilase family protein/Big-like domain-containing protein/GEVED domain-containing protein/dockerin type I repeat protein/fervidolysin-like protein
MFFESLETRQVLSTFPAPLDSWNQAEFLESQAIVRFRADATDQQITQLLSAMQVGVVSKWDELDMYHIRFATVRGRDQTIAAVKALHENSLVEYAEPNFVSHLDQVPNDPLFLNQWGLHNVGQNSPYPPFLGGAFDGDIDAVEAWDTLTGDPNTVIAIVDTGVDYQHPDLLDNIWRNPGEIPDGIDNDGNGFVDDVLGWDTFDNDNDPMDFAGHGTHVAGISGAATDNNIGVAGVNWNAKLMLLKASDDAGTGLSSAAIVGAQAYITRMKTQFGVNVVVSNNSYGGPTFSFAQFDAIRIATNAGIAFVAAAGNNGFSTDNPGNIQYPMGFNLPGIISVAATTRDDTLATFSNFGFFTVDLGAPGEEILSTWSEFAPAPPAQPPAPNIPPPGYAWLDGTSMASPMVAGAYALLKTFDPQLTVAQIKNLLITTVDLLPSLINRSVSGGRLNLARALDEIPRNEFHGRVFLDLDGDGRFDPTESTQSGWTLYVDLNNNEVLDANEPSTLSQADGTYNLRAKLLRGDYFIREVIQPGWIQTYPGASDDHAHRVTVTSPTEVFEDLDFGNKPIPGSVLGTKYNDVNGNGQRDAGEPGLAGFVIYVDINNDGIIGVGEPAAITDAQGRFQINNVRPGVQIVREVQKPGFVQTEPDPAGPLAGGISVLVVGNSVASGLLFGNRSAIDWGDAPASYGTLGANNGARHGLLPGFFLGDASDTASTHIDDEANGLPNVDASGDDLNQDDDEDGVIFVTDIIPGQNATIQVSVSSGAYGSGFLHGWIDFNNDGDFFDAGEQIIKNRSLSTGTHLITFAVPAGATVADTYARFRWGIQRDLAPTGLANGGEVEDYTTAARAIAPTAINDFATAGRDSNFIDNPIDVMANDFPGVSGAPIQILDFEPTSTHGGLVILDDQGNADPTDDILRYKPAPGFLGQGAQADTFQYRIWDGVNISNSATVTIDVVPLDPVAVDDTFDVFQGVTTDLDVLANDIEGVNGPLSVVAIGAKSAGGTTSIVGGKIRYTPPSPSFQGPDSFSYTVSDGTNVSTAQVLVQVGGPTANQIVQIEFKVFRSNGSEILANQTVQPGESIELRGFTLDRRAQFADPDVPSILDARGVLSAWVDALYDSDLVTPVAAANIFGVDISFPFYNTLTSATASVPGIVDEAGGLHVVNAGDPPIGPGPHLLFNLKLTVNDSTGGPLKFSPNPEEDSPTFTFETTVNDDVPGFPSVIVVPNDQIFFKSSPTIQVVGSGEGEGTNVANPLDVNQDTIVSPLDALLVISQLNRFGAGTYSPMLAAASGQGVPENFLDVNVDGMVTAMDAKLVIDYLNERAAAARASSLQPEGEGEGDANTALLVSSTSSISSTSSSASTPTTTASDQVEYADSVDQVFVDDRFVTKPAPSAIAPVEEHDDEEVAEEDDFFTVLGSN